MASVGSRRVFPTRRGGRRAIEVLLLGATLLALVLPLLAVAEAQTTKPVLVERSDDEIDLAARLGEPATAHYSLFNLNPENDFFVTISAKAPVDWTVTISNERFFLAPRNQTLIEFVFEPQAEPRVTATFTLTFNLVDGRTGDVTTFTEVLNVASSAAPRVLDLFPNPLPAPFDNVYGTFLLDLVFWVGIGLVAIFAGDTIVRVLTTRASNAVTREILHKLRRPVFYFVLFLGLARSVAVLPRNAITDFLIRFLFAIGVGVFGLYVVFRILDSILYYISKELATRTETRIDDVLIPVLRKVGIFVLYLVGIIYVLRELGWDPTVIFAGAGIAGLVIAFAAQDTFSNLFSGVFLLLDRPFKEGDDIRLSTDETVRVQNIGLRTTRLYHPRSHESIIVPNNQLATERVINLSGPDLRYWVMVDIGVSYNSDPRTVEAVLLSIAEDDPDILDEEGWKPIVIFSGFGDSSLNFIFRVAVKDFRNRFAVASRLRFKAFEAFAQHDIEIPFPQRVIHMAGPRVKGAKGEPPSYDGTTD